MATLTADDVRHIAKLARLTLSTEDVPRLTKELSSILSHIDMLSELDTSTVEPTAQVTGLTNALRDDVVKENEATGDALLTCSPLPITEHQIDVPHAHG